MNRSECTALIERLAGGDVGEFLTINSTRIGNILENMGIRFCEPTPHKSTTLGYRLLEIWRHCGFSKSLFEILEESEWEECNGERWHWECNRDCQLWMLKSPAKELFLFLDQLFPA